MKLYSFLTLSTIVIYRLMIRQWSLRSYNGNEKWFIHVCFFASWEHEIRHAQDVWRCSSLQGEGVDLEHGGILGEIAKPCMAFSMDGVFENICTVVCKRENSQWRTSLELQGAQNGRAPSLKDPVPYITGAKILF